LFLDIPLPERVFILQKYRQIWNCWIYIHHKKISPTALADLDAFVSNGCGLLAIHSATASFKETKHYFEILGGRFIGHGKVEKFKVEKLESEIFDGIGDFVVRDELYIHELKSGITVHFTAKHEGKDVPVVWTVRYSKGKVCYAVLGHTTASMKHPAVQEILRRGLAWKMPPLLGHIASFLLCGIRAIWGFAAIPFMMLCQSMFELADYPIMIFGRYCNASAKCTDWIVSLPSRSAMVRDNFRMR
jgi:type 1 glutamine amidotransferase